MRNLLFVSAFIFFSCGISRKPVALKSTYNDSPYEIVTSKSFDETWSSLIDLFAQKGLSIKVIDKSSGLIVSEKTSFVNNYTQENKKGELINPNAWVVVSKTSNGDRPTAIEGEWNVRLKKSNNGGTSINVNLTNVKASAKTIGTPYVPSYELTFDAKSTGNFEKLISDQIK